MRVGLADDSYVLRRGLRLLLETLGVEVAFEAADAPVLLELVAADPPDAVIVDIKMPDTDEGLVAAETLAVRYPKLGVLVLSQYTETAYAMRLLEARGHGVGYLHKDRVDDDTALVRALEQVCAGELAVEPVLVERMIKYSLADEFGLTPRERDVLSQMAEGLSNAGIGHTLGLAESTVETYVTKIFQKLDLSVGADGHRRVLAVLRWLDNNERPHTVRPSTTPFGLA